jgi:cytoskeleton-associated protein 5
VVCNYILIFLEYAIPQIIQEKNASALDKGLAAIQAFVDRYKFATRFVFSSHFTYNYRTAEDVVPVAIEKHFNSKPSSVEIVTEILLLYIEIDSGAYVTGELIKRLSHKTLKIRIGSISTLIAAIKSFGASAIPVKDVLKSLVSLFEDSDKKMRDLATELTVEIYRWIRDIVRPHIEGLRSTQMTDLETKFKETQSEPVQPTRMLRSKSKSGSSAPSSGPINLPQFDPNDLLDPVDILKELKSSWFSDIVSLCTYVLTCFRTVQNGLTDGTA